MPWVKVWKVVTSWFQMAVILVRNSSLVFHRVAKAPTTTPTAAAIPAIARVTGLIAAVKAAKTPPPPDNVVKNVENPEIIFGRVVVANVYTCCPAI